MCYIEGIADYSIIYSRKPGIDRFRNQHGSILQTLLQIMIIVISYNEMYYLLREYVRLFLQLSRGLTNGIL